MTDQPPSFPISRRTVLAAGLSAGLAACAADPAARRAATGGSFDAWAEGFAADWMRLSPERSTSTQYFEGAEQDALDRQSSPPTQVRRERERALARSGLAAVNGFLAGALPAEQRGVALTIQWNLQRALAAEPFEDHGFPFNQLSGLQVRSVSFLTQTHPLRKPGDVQSYLARLAQVPARFDDAIARTRVAAARGILPPRFILERGRGQIEAYLKTAPAENPFVTALATRSAGIAALPAADRALAIQQAQGLVDKDVRPAFERALALLNELHPRTTADAGLWRLPDGAAAYAQALADYTTTTLSADEIHAIGLREVARIEREMDRVLQGMGRRDGTVRERMDKLEAELQPPAQPDPRPALLARYTAFVREAQERALPLFNLKPKAPVEVRRVPALTERTASAYYTTPAPDGSRPGIFWAPLPGPTFDIARMKSLAIHEAVPGHHFQLALQQEEVGLPKWRQFRVFGGGSANSEGWALYAERLAVEEGWYEGDAVGLLGGLASELFRARRLVVDTGLHAKRWTREQAIDYGISAREVERYVANPGQACAYMIGMLRILELREQAKAAQGPKFTLPRFHDVVLKAGSVPLDVLGEVVRRWSAASVA